MNIIWYNFSHEYNFLIKTHIISVRFKSQWHWRRTIFLYFAISSIAFVIGYCSVCNSSIFTVSSAKFIFLFLPFLDNLFSPLVNIFSIFRKWYGALSITVIEFSSIFSTICLSKFNQSTIFVSLCPIRISPILFMYRYLILFYCWGAISTIRDILSHPNRHFVEKYIASVNSCCPSPILYVRYPFSSASTSNSDRDTWFSLSIQVDSPLARLSMMMLLIQTWWRLISVKDIRTLSRVRPHWQRLNTFPNFGIIRAELTLAFTRNCVAVSAPLIRINALEFRLLLYGPAAVHLFISTNK